ncbi:MULTISPECIES: mycolate reductase [Corynebacterium]|uniref:Sulfoacetaldehyde reductase n=1 Tax=Corynebacterium provencense TaxID=1737425 RepID=A0A2Z3YR49_9CORY|nr:MULTISPECIES: mycolate reductase [Corynebacterium]AWT26709.1 Sulfoacetaldehyde reductase [Corynebacterium provencense]MCI1256790.1 mycolate reductase [Corynebacterium provencense]
MFFRSSENRSLPAPGPDRVAVVTGASSGIGRAVALELGRRGHNLLLVARTAGPMEQIRDSLAAEGSPVHVEIRTCDLAEPTARGELVAELAGRDVSILVNSAGVATFGQFRRLDPARERAQFELNATAVFELTAAVLPGMVAGGDAGIVNVGSVAGNAAIPNNATYVGTKAMVNTFTEALHYELKGTGVRCTLLAPGPVREEVKQDAERTIVDRATPDFVWTTYPDCATETLDALAANRLRVVPGGLSKIANVISTYLPRRVTAPLLGRVYARMAED